MLLPRVMSRGMIQDLSRSELFKHRQARGSHGLAVTLLLLIGSRHLDLIREIWKFFAEHATRRLEDDVATFPGGDAAKNQKVSENIKVCVVGNAVAEVTTDRLKYLPCGFVVVPPITEVSGSDPQLFFQERLHEVQRTLERLAAARGLATPEQLGFPKELPPTDTVPRLLVQLALIEDAAKVVLSQQITLLTSFKVQDPETVAEADSEQIFLLRLPVRVRLQGSLPAVMQVLGALQHARPIIDLQGVQLTTASENPDELEVELVLSRYLIPEGAREFKNVLAES